MARKPPQTPKVKTDRDPGYVRDILKAATQVHSYVHGVHRGKFDRNHMLYDAVCRQLGIVGEASACLSSTFKERHPKIPWRDIIRLRQILLHTYWRTDKDVIWTIVKHDIRILIAYLRKLAKSKSPLDAEVAMELTAKRATRT